MFEAVIFDCDGVLVDSEIIALDIERATLREFGVETEAEAYVDRFMGLDNNGWRAALVEDFPVMAGRVDAYQALTKERYYAKLNSEALRPVADARDAIAAFGGPKAVASSSGANSLAHKLTHTGLFPLFDPHVYSTDIVGIGKPAPDIFLHAAREIGADPARCLVIEDSRNGVRAGLAAGMTVWGFIGGAHCFPSHAAMLQDTGAARVLTSWREAADIFAGWR